HLRWTRLGLRGQVRIHASEDDPFETIPLGPHHQLSLRLRSTDAGPLVEVRLEGVTFTRTGELQTEVLGGFEALAGPHALVRPAVREGEVVYLSAPRDETPPAGQVVPLPGAGHVLGVAQRDADGLHLLFEVEPPAAPGLPQVEAA